MQDTRLSPSEIGRVWLRLPPLDKAQVERRRLGKPIDVREQQGPLGPLQLLWPQGFREAKCQPCQEPNNVLLGARCAAEDGTSEVAMLPQKPAGRVVGVPERVQATTTTVS